LRHPGLRAGALSGLGALFVAALSGCASSGLSSPAATQPLANAPLANAQSATHGAITAAQLSLSRTLWAPQIPASRGPGWLSGDAKAGKNVVYSGDFENSKINIYPIKGHNPAPIGSITTGIQNPERLFVDKKLKLYVTNATDVTVYPPGATSPSLTISSGINNPTGLTVGPDGTVYVANVNTDSVTEYRKGKTSPSVTLNIPGSPENLAVDANSNLFVSFFGSQSNVLEFSPGQMNGTNLGLAIGSPGPLEVDSAGDVAIIDTSTNDLDIFPPEQTQPSIQTHYTDGNPFELAFGKGQNKLYASVETTASAYFQIDSLTYPSGTPQEQIATQPYQSFESWPLAVSPDGEP